MKVRIGVGLGGREFADARAFWRWVSLCEDSAIDSLWCSDRLISDRPTLEPMTTIAALAGATRRLQFGMNAVVLPYRDPLVLAKECATIDWLSGGRLIAVFGVGAAQDRGWRATARSPGKRGRQADEMLAIMNRLFADDEVSFAGEFYTYEAVSIAPKPVRRPLPLWIGGNSDAAIRRTARYGTGWLGGFTPLETSRQVVAGIRRAAEAEGRRIDDDHFGITIGFRFGAADDPEVQRFHAARRARSGAGADVSSSIAVGGAKEIVGLMARYVDAGVSKFVAVPMASSDEDFIAQTARLAEVVPQAEALGAA